MANVNMGPMVVAALLGSFAILATMYFLLPALGLPKLDFTAVTSGWVGAAGKYAKLVGAAVFLLGGIGWAYIYAQVWPWHSPLGGLFYGGLPFAISMGLVLPQLSQFRVMMVMPGFIWSKVGGPRSVVANLIEHLVFGLVLGLLYH